MTTSPISDLTMIQSAECFTIRVHNYKDDPRHDAISLHGLFTDRAEAERIARAVSVAWDFITADVLPIQSSTIAQIADAQDISHIEPDLPAGFTENEAATEREGRIARFTGSDEADALAVVVHAADSSLTGLSHGWDDANFDERFYAREIAVAALVDSTTDKDALVALVSDIWGEEPETGADQRIEAKATAIQQWFTQHPEFLIARSSPTDGDIVTADGVPADQRDPVADAIALAPVVHEADWTMAGPRWPWHLATGAQREDALLIAQAAVADPTMDDDALEALVARLWSTKPKHGAPRRVSAKASKIREWLVREGLREGGLGRP